MLYRCRPGTRGTRPTSATATRESNPGTLPNGERRLRG